MDDNEDAASLLAEALGKLGHDVRVAGDGPSALEIAPGFAPQVALVDVGLPAMDGYEVARRLRALALPEEVRLVALTGYGHEDARTRSAEVGFAAHLVKPITLEALLEAIGG